MRSSRLQQISPSTSLRRLKTALATVSPIRSTSSSSTSPLSGGSTSASSQFSDFNFDFDFSSGMFTSSLPSRVDARRVIRRKKSCVEVEQEEERNEISDKLVALIEPRPRAGAASGGIEEVLKGMV